MHSGPLFLVLPFKTSSRPNSEAERTFLHILLTSNQDLSVYPFNLSYRIEVLPHPYNEVTSLFDHFSCYPLILYMTEQKLDFSTFLT